MEEFAFVWCQTRCMVAVDIKRLRFSHVIQASRFT